MNYTGYREEKLMTRKSIEKLLARAQTLKAEAEADYEDIKKNNMWFVCGRVLGRLNKANEKLEIAEKLLAAIDEGKKVYKVASSSVTIQSPATHYGYEIKEDK